MNLLARGGTVADAEGLGVILACPGTSIFEPIGRPYHSVPASVPLPRLAPTATVVLHESTGIPSQTVR